MGMGSIDARKMDPGLVICYVFYPVSDMLVVILSGKTTLIVSGHNRPAKRES